MKPQRSTFPKWGWFLLPAIALAWKGLWLWRSAFPFNADEAIVALMARHILHGGRPIFFYGQAYMGSLDAFLVAAAFKVLGQKVLAIRLAQAVLYAITVDLSAYLALRLSKNPLAAWATGLLLAVPTVNMTLYTTVSLGGYGEALLIGTVLLILALRPCSATPLGAAVWGALFGLGLWAFGFVAVYVLPAALFVFFKWQQECKFGFRKQARLALFGAFGAVLGAFPWWWYGVEHGWRPLLNELLGSAVAVEHAGWVARTAHHLLSFLALGLPVTFGVRPPWGVEMLVPPLAALVVGIYVVWVLEAWRQRSFPSGGAWLLWGVAATLVAGFLFTSFGVDPSGRYFLPLTQVLFVGFGCFLGEVMRRARWLGIAALGIILLFHGMSTAQAASNPYRITTQFAPDARIRPGYEKALMNFLRSHHLFRGYTNYWVAYPLAFLSEERIIFTPRLPYHQDLRYTPRDDRYPPYDRLVECADRVAYITTGQPALEKRLREGFRARAGVSWKEKRIGDYRIFYALSAPIRPWELGISPPLPLKCGSGKAGG